MIKMPAFTKTLRRIVFAVGVGAVPGQNIGLDKPIVLSGEVGPDGPTGATGPTGSAGRDAVTPTGSCAPGLFVRALGATGASNAASNALVCAAPAGDLSSPAARALVLRPSDFQAEGAGAAWSRDIDLLLRNDPAQATDMIASAHLPDSASVQSLGCAAIDDDPASEASPSDTLHTLAVSLLVQVGTAPPVACRDGRSVGGAASLQTITTSASSASADCTASAVNDTSAPSPRLFLVRVSTQAQSLLSLYACVLDYRVASVYP